MEALKQDVKHYPDAYQYERVVGVSQRGIRYALRQEWFCKCLIEMATFQLEPVVSANRHARGRRYRCFSSFVLTHLFTGAINANIFYAWVAQDLLPQLPSNSVVVMDNAAFHS